MMWGSVRGRLAALSAGSVAQAAANGVAALLTTLVLGPQERGIMVLGLTIGGIGGLIGGLGTGAAFRSTLPSASGDARCRLVSAYTWITLVGTPCAALAAAGAAAGSAPLIDPEMARPATLMAVAAFTVSQLLLTQMVDGWFADGHFSRGSAAAALMSGGGLAGVLVVLPFSESAPVLLIAQATGCTAVCVSQVPGLRRASLWSVAQPRRVEIAHLLRKGVPALGMTLGMAVVGRADRYFLGAASGAAAVGVYSLAATLSEMPRLLPTAVGQLLYRDVAVDRRGARLGRSTALALSATAVSGVVVTVGGFLLIGPVFGADFAEARGVLVVLLLAELAFAPYAVATRGLLGGGWSRAAGLAGVGAGVMACLLYAVAAPLAGAYGVAMASIAIYGGLSATTYIQLRRRLRRSAEPAPADD